VAKEAPLVALFPLMKLMGEGNQLLLLMTGFREDIQICLGFSLGLVLFVRSPLMIFLLGNKS
jgi:hypothetical protein